MPGAKRVHIEVKRVKDSLTPPGSQGKISYFVVSFVNFPFFLLSFFFINLKLFFMDIQVRHFLHSEFGNIFRRISRRDLLLLPKFFTRC